MKRIVFIMLVFAVYLNLVSCNRITPAGFWNSYQKELLVDNVSDHGPFGGHSALFWKSTKEDAFTSNQVLDFARQNGWSLIDSFKCSREQTSNWIYNSEPVFPLTSSGFSSKELNNSQVAKFPRRIEGEIAVYKFKTGWITIEPGTDNTNEENGYALINSNGTDLAVYHIWGE